MGRLAVIFSQVRDGSGGCCSEAESLSRTILSHRGQYEQSTQGCGSIGAGMKLLTSHLSEKILIRSLSPLRVSKTSMFSV